jgi:hypothetical protein
MYAFDIRDLGGADYSGDIQVTAGTGGFSYADGLIRHTRVHRIPVRFGKDGDGLYTEFTAGADYAQGDLTPVGDQYF